MNRAFLISCGALLLGMDVFLLIENRSLHEQLLANQFALVQTQAKFALESRGLPSSNEALGRVADSERSHNSSSLATSAQGRRQPIDRFNDAVLRVEAKYGRFFQQLKNWSPERIESLKRQLASNDLAMMTLGESIDYSSPNGGMKDLGERLRAKRKEYDEALRTTLGPDFEKFDNAEKMESYRGSVEAITNAMRSRNVQIGDEQQESILAAYSAAIQESAKNLTQVDPTSMTAKQLTDLKAQQTDDFRKLVIKHMGTVLDGKQLDAFLESQIEQEEKQ